MINHDLNTPIHLRAPDDVYALYTRIGDTLALYGAERTHRSVQWLICDVYDGVWSGSIYDAIVRLLRRYVRD